MTRTPEWEWRGVSGSGAAVAVGGGEVLDGLAADEVIHQLAVDDEIHGLGWDALVIDGVGTDKLLPLKVLRVGSSVTLRNSGRTEA